MTVSDGVGGWRPGRFGDELEVVGSVQRVAARTPSLTVAFALVKGGRPELVVQKLTELGVDVIRPFAAARSVVRWDDAKADHQLQRLRRIAREASMQCRRCHLPTVEPVAAFADVAALPGAVLANRSGQPPTLQHPTILIGPEGGWEVHELADRPTVALGPHVLRAETAAITAGALLAALRDGVVQES